MDLELVDLTLSEVSDGALESRFQELLSEVIGINECASAYVGASDGTRTSRITLEIEIRHRPAIGGDHASTTIVSGGELKRPKRLKSAQPAHLTKDGTLVVVKNPPEQLAVFEGEGSGGVLSRIPATSRKGVGNDGE